MSFFERAKAAATDLAAKADAEMKKAGISTPGTAAAGGHGAAGERALRDLGVLAYLEATGRPTSADDRARLVGTLRDLESAGQLGPLTVAPAPYGSPGSPPPPPGAAAAAAAAPPPPPPPSGPGSMPPPPPASDAGSPPPPPPPHEVPPGSTPPPPPPSWA